MNVFYDFIRILFPRNQNIHSKVNFLVRLSRFISMNDLDVPTVLTVINCKKTYRLYEVLIYKNFKNTLT